jgi:hypothetical protein
MKKKHLKKLLKNRKKSRKYLQKILKPSVPLSEIRAAVKAVSKKWVKL